MFEDIDKIAQGMSIPGLAVVLLYGLYRGWWYISPTVKQMVDNEKTRIAALERERDEYRSKAEKQDAALDAANKELNETKVVYATLQARYESLEQSLKAQRNRRSPAP